MPRQARLRNPAEFKSVYETGRRYDGSLMTAFVMRSGHAVHRLGITASRKMARRAVDRNRAKRLLREVFRLSGAELGKLEGRYDWVLNPRRSVLRVKVSAPLKEFQSMIARVRIDERDASAEGGGR